uniref:Synaptic plasticity regulator PANTS n=1 Tax=Falco tinnunculus TaxID=100819 RepID=A0A8C4UQ24_FALTI
FLDYILPSYILSGGGLVLCLAFSSLSLCSATVSGKLFGVVQRNASTRLCRASLQGASSIFTQVLGLGIVLSNPLNLLFIAFRTSNVTARVGEATPASLPSAAEGGRSCGVPRCRVATGAASQVPAWRSRAAAPLLGPVKPPRPCEDYWWEWKHCRGLRHAFHHYYAHGELPACGRWRDDYEACRAWESGRAAAAQVPGLRGGWGPCRACGGLAVPRGRSWCSAAPAPARRCVGTLRGSRGSLRRARTGKEASGGCGRAAAPVPGRGRSGALQLPSASRCGFWRFHSAQRSRRLNTNGTQLTACILAHLEIVWHLPLSMIKLVLSQIVTAGNKLLKTGPSTTTVVIYLFFSLLYFRKLCARVKELELWKNRNTLQCGSSGRAHHLTGIFHLTKTNQIRETVLLFPQSCNTQCKIMLVSSSVFFLPCHLEIIQPQLFPAVL